MNKACAAVYARSIGVPRPLLDKAKDDLIDCLPDLLAEVQRMEEIMQDPFIKGYLAMREELRAQGKEACDGT